MHERYVGFTLIEILVVVAVISILVAILLPVLASVQEKGRQSACLNNTHQLALAMFAPYVHNDKVRLRPSDAKAKSNSYGVNELAFHDETDPDNLAVPLNILASFKAPTQTIMLGDIGTADDLKTDKPDAHKMMPPDQPLKDHADARPSARHQGFVNLAFMGGHRKSMRLEQFYAGQRPLDKWFTP